MTIKEHFSLIQSTDDKDLWNKFVTANLNADIFHVWEWGEVLSETYGYPKYYLTIKDGGEIIGVLPILLVRSSFFANRLVSLPFCDYAGPLLKTHLESSTAEATIKKFYKGLNELTQKLKLDYAQLRQPPSVLSTFLSSIGFTVLQRYLTLRIDITKNELSLWNNLDKKTRNSIRKAMKSGVRIKDVSSDGIKQYYKLYLATQKKHRSPPNSYDFFVNIFNKFRPKGWLQMTHALYDGQPIAGIMSFCFNRKIYWWNGVSLDKYRSLNPTNLLLWHLIKWGAENNFEKLDLGKTRVEAEGIYRFKSGWGGIKLNLKDYLLYRKKVNLPDPLQKKYLLMGTVWSWLPQALAQRVGPRVIRQIAL